MSSDRLYFRQLLSGRDFAVGDPLAQQMVNFVYAIGDRVTGEAVLVDPAYAVNELVSVVEGDNMRITGALATHYHADHIGGSMMGYSIEGITTLLDRCNCAVHVQAAEVPWVTRTTGVTGADLAVHDPGDTLQVGEIEITMLHTPGHTPGSQCFLVEGMLISGDTLFLEGCGRTDLPGSDPELMFSSLQLLGSLPDETVVYPGHMYSTPSSQAMGEVRDQNYIFKPRTQQAWMQWFGGAKS